jgi:DNA-binding NtrC family response regulator
MPYEIRDAVFFSLSDPLRDMVSQRVIVDHIDSGGGEPACSAADDGTRADDDVRVMERRDPSSALAVLVVEDDPVHAARMRDALLRVEPSVRVTTAGRLRNALEALQDPSIACVITDLRLPDAEGVAVLRDLRSARHELPVIVVTGAGSEEMAVAAMKLGAVDYVTKHARYVERLPILVREALGRSVLTGVDHAGVDYGRPRPAAADEQPFVAATTNMRAVLALVERAARSSVPILLEGETGTGKEVLARAIHASGRRPQAPFLVQNCAANADALLESELFGHRRGAFTGADRYRHGLFAEAGDGTVFLDEIGEAPASVQAKLLRVLQHQEVKAVGADRVRPVRARIVAASNRALDSEVKAGRFRSDLFYRLAVFPIRVPALRQRAADVPALVAHFLRRAEADEGRKTGGVDLEALRALQTYGWPGNVRELENEIHRLVLSVGHGEQIGRRHLARRIREAESVALDEPLARILERVEIALIRERLQTKATKSAAARSLGITRETLYAKMRRLGIATCE